MAKSKGSNGNGKKGAGRNNGPSRQKYWATGKLAENKIKSLMTCNGLTRAEAFNLWSDTRKSRMKTGASKPTLGSIVAKHKVAS